MSSQLNNRNKALKMMLWFGIGSLFMTFAGLTSAFIVSKNREAMDKIVDLLIEKETLDGEEFTNILSKFTSIPEKERTPQLLS